MAEGGRRRKSERHKDGRRVRDATLPSSGTEEGGHKPKGVVGF